MISMQNLAACRECFWNGKQEIEENCRGQVV
jgi:hypothetical protein